MKTDSGHMVHPLKKWTMGLKENPEPVLKRWWASVAVLRVTVIAADLPL